MINTWIVDIALMILVGVVSFAPSAARASLPSQTPQWRLSEYLTEAQNDPAQLMAIAQKLFAKDVIEGARKDPALAYAWQDRLAMLAALSHLYDPEHEHRGKPFWNRASHLIETALSSDPSLLVRDAAVEAMRRINRMRPGYIAKWKSSLETAFVSLRNQSNGEGYFIRETILSTMREASLRPSTKVMNAARGDTNARVRSRLDEWNTSAF